MDVQIPLKDAERAVRWGRLAWIAPLFFLVKGLAWLALPLALAWMGLD